MPIQYVGGNTATKAGATNGTSTISLTTLTGGISSSAAAGDLVIAVFATGSTADRALSITDGTNNYTLVGSELYANGSSYDTNLRVAYKYLTAADTSVTFGPTGNNADAGAMVVHVWRGVDSSIFDVAATTAIGNSTGRPTPPAITPATSGTVIVMAGGSAAAAGAVFTASDLSNFRTATSADTQDASVGIGSVDWTSGTYTPAQWTGGTTNAADSWAAVTMALKAAPQVLTAPLTTNIQTFHAATVTKQNQDLQPPPLLSRLISTALAYPPLITRSTGIKYLGSATTEVNPSTGTNTTLSLTSVAAGNGAQAGDLVIAFYATESGNVDRTLSITDGTNDYTLIASELYSTNGTSIAINLRAAYKYLTAADTSVTFGPTGSTIDNGVVGVQVWRGVDSSTPLDVTPTTWTGGAVPPDPPAITPTTVGAVVVAVGAGVQSIVGEFTSSDLSSFSTKGNGSFAAAQIGFGSIEWVSGTVDPAAFGYGPVSLVQAAAITMALRPAATGDQTLTPGRHDNSQALYAATITTGAVSLSPSLFSNDATFYAATVAAGGSAQEVSPGLLSSGLTFHAGTVTVGATALSPARLDNPQTFHAGTVTVGATALSPARLDNPQTFHAGTVTVGATALSPARLDNPQTFHAVTVTVGGVVLQPALVSSTPQFYSGSLSTGAVALAPPRLDNEAAFFAAVVAQGAGPQAVFPGLLITGNTFHAVAVTAGEVTLLATLLANEPTFHAAAATLVAAPTFGAAILAEKSSDALSATGVIPVQGGLSVLEGADSAAATGTLFSSFVLTGRQALLLKQIAQLHGLIEPMTVGPTQRVAGDLVQTVTTTGGATVVQTVSSGDTFHGDAGDWIERLAALHGIGADLNVTPTARSAGTVLQTFGAIGQSTLVVTQ